MPSCEFLQLVKSSFEHRLIVSAHFLAMLRASPILSELTPNLIEASSILIGVSLNFTELSPVIFEAAPIFTQLSSILS